MNCDVCGKPIEVPGDVHDYHDPECPNANVQQLSPLGKEVVLADDWFPCTCDFHAHPACCPVCNAVRSVIHAP